MSNDHSDPTAPVQRQPAREALVEGGQAVTRECRLLLALSQAAAAVQRARTPQEVYRIVLDQLVRLGYHATIFTTAEDHLCTQRWWFLSQKGG
jgi:hypothetical protein